MTFCILNAKRRSGLRGAEALPQQLDTPVPCGCSCVCVSALAFQAKVLPASQGQCLHQQLIIRLSATKH
ncbi:hypothetical protein EYF80_055776 [Liparis tanakae]|uniref:Uncharacterized protein n=1 Tax=Liparis tanakae TaxID=230148 RepID=A0A4Z2EZ69_9TELE|nr:hypothetical protein EYF80_055776 [Liparis tanakae]